MAKPSQQNSRAEPGRTAVVTGASQGIGLAIARELLEAGYRVLGLCRHPGEEKAVEWISCDVSQPDSVERAFAEVFRRTSRVDLLVNNAGMGISGAAEFTSEEDMHRQFEVNVYGAVRCSRAVFPGMREQGGGRIVFVSSLAALFPIAFQSFYSMSKAALNSFSTALGIEGKPFGIQTGILLLGDVRTGFTGSRLKSPEGDAIYNGRIQRSVTKMEQDEQQGMQPGQIAKAAVRMVAQKRLSPLRIVGLSNKLLAFFERILPLRLVHWILWKLYG